MKWQKLVTFYEAFQAHPSSYGEVVHNSDEKCVNVVYCEAFKTVSKKLS